MGLIICCLVVSLPIHSIPFRLSVPKITQRAFRMIGMCNAFNRLLYSHDRQIMAISNHPIPCARGCMWLRIISIGKIQRNWLNHVPKCHTIAHEKRCLLTRVTIWQHGVCPNGANEEKHRGESFQDQCPIGKKSEVERAKDLAGWIHISVALAHGYTSSYMSM